MFAWFCALFQWFFLARFPVFLFFFPHTLFIYLPLAAASIFYMRSPRCTRSLCFLTRCHRHRRRRLRLRRRRRPVCTSICSNRFKMMATDLWWFISVHSPVRVVHRAPFRRHPYTLTQTARHTHTHTLDLSFSLALPLAASWSFWLWQAPKWQSPQHPVWHLCDFACPICVAFPTCPAYPGNAATRSRGDF